MRLHHVLGHSTQPSPDNPPFEKIECVIEAYLDSLLQHNYSSYTMLAYRAALLEFADFVKTHECLQGDWRICDTRCLTQFFAKRLEEDGLKVVSAKLELTAIRQFYHYAIAKGLTTLNPALNYRLTRHTRAIPKIADEALMERLLDQQPPDDSKKLGLWARDKAMFELMYSSGLRVSELVGLDVADIDSANKNVRVLGKGNKMRLVPVGHKALQALQAYLPHRQLWQAHGQALFVSQQGKRLTTRSVQLRLKSFASSAGIDQRLYPHLLRHCFASHLLSASGDLRAIQEMLGHASISATQIYTHVDVGSLTKVYDKTHPRAAVATKKSRYKS